MGNNKKGIPQEKIWWKRVQPLKLLLASFPSVSQSELRWALYQVILSFVFFFVAIAIGILTIDVSVVGGGFMIAAIIFFSLGGLALLYGVGLGLHWYKVDSEKREKRMGADSLHTDIRDAIDEMRENRKAINTTIKNIERQTNVLVELVENIRGKNEST